MGTLELSQLPSATWARSAVQAGFDETAQGFAQDGSGGQQRGRGS